MRAQPTSRPEVRLRSLRYSEKDRLNSEQEKENT